MKIMANYSPILENLTPFTAPDMENTGVMLNVRINPEDKEWLKQLEGGMSYHVRQALALYRRVRENPDLARLIEEQRAN